MKSQKELLHNVFDREEWLVLLLDACRYDYFREEDTINGSLSKVKSEGSSTREWASGTFTNSYYDFTYLSANPHINSEDADADVTVLGKDKFREIVDIWDFGWSEKLGTVHPKEVIDTIKDYKDKDKIFAHFMQPHCPYIGEYAGPEWSRPRSRLKDTKCDVKGELDVNVESAYRTNLRLVLEHILMELDSLEKKTTIITADHGDLFENNKPKHDGGSSNPILRNVPWKEVE